MHYRPILEYRSLLREYVALKLPKDIGMIKIYAYCTPETCHAIQKILILNFNEDEISYFFCQITLEQGPKKAYFLGTLEN